MRESLKTDLERSKRDRAELERIEKYQKLKYGSETRNIDHAAIVAEM